MTVGLTGLAAGALPSRRGSALACLTAFPLFYYCMGALISVVSLYLDDRGLATGDLSLVVSASALLALVLQPLVGIVADLAGGPRVPAVACMGVALVSTVGLALGRGTGELFVANGLSQGLIVAAVPLLDSLALASGLPYGRVKAGGSVGYALGVQLVGVLYEGMGAVAALGSVVAAGLGCLVAVWLAREGSWAPEPGASDGSATGMAAQLGELLRTRAYLVLLVVSFVLLGLHYANIAYMPLLVRAGGGGPSLMGTILLAQTLFEVAVVFLSDRIAERLGNRGMLVLTSVAMAVRMLWYATCPSDAALLGAFFFQGLSAGLFYVVVVRMVSEVVPRELTNTALALSGLVGKGLGALALEALGGALLASGGFSLMYGVLGTIGLVGVVAALSLRDGE